MMSARMLCVALLLCAVGVVGCGGGGGSSSSAKSSANKTTATNRVVATCRIEQATFAIVGLGRPITRTARPRLGLQGLVALSRRGTRDVTQGQDSGTKLYYTRTINTDGSGELDLFLDSARSKPAGNLTWVAPDWNQGQLNGYPATIHMTFQITAGQFSGDRGTLDNATQDVTGNNETLHLVLTDAQNETVTCDFKVVNGVLTGKVNGTLSGGTTFVENDTIGLDGVLQCLVSFADGSQETLSTDPNGDGTETYADPDGSTECNTNYDDSGDDTIDYSDGSSETVNVDDGDDSSS
jgi:hypothetical protein